jgi:hypothetical protein
MAMEFIQKYSHDGKLLMQIGERGVVDTSDGTNLMLKLNDNVPFGTFLEMSP